MNRSCFVLLCSVLSIWPSLLLAQETDDAATQGELKLTTRIDFKGKPFPAGLRFSPDGSQIWLNQLDGWKVPSGESLEWSPSGDLQGLHFIDFAEQRRMLVVSKATGYTLVGQDGKIAERKLARNGAVVDARLIDGGNRFAVWFSKPPQLYFGDLKNGGEDTTVALPTGATRGILSASGQVAVMRDKGEVNVWDVKTRKNRTTFHHDQQVTSVAVSPDEKLVATGARDNLVRLFDAQTGTLRTTLAGHGQGTIFLPSAVYSLSFSPDGQWLVSGGHDGKVVVWDVANAKERSHAKIPGPPIVSSVAFSPDGKSVAASFENAGARRGIRVWALPE